jgi:hypothetical protein
MATQAPIKIRDADALDVNTSGTLLDNGHTRPSVGVGGPDGAADLAPCNATDGLFVKLTNPGDISGAALSLVSTHHRVAAGSGDAVSVKASAGTLRSVHYFNLDVVPHYVKFHNTAGTPTPGSGVVFTVGVQAGTSRELVLPGGGRAFATGIGMSIVTGIADSGSTGVTASTGIVEVAYE